MSKTIPQQPLTEKLRTTLLMLYSKRLFYPGPYRHGMHCEMEEMADMIGISRTSLVGRMNVLRDSGYVKGRWGELEFIPIEWKELLCNKGVEDESGGVNI